MKIDCFDLARQLIARGLSSEKIIESITKYNRRKELWTIEIIERIKIKLKRSYDNRTFKRLARFKIKVCKFPGCGKEYLGYPNTKFCDFHQIIKNRQISKDEKKQIEKKEDDENRIIKHEYEDITLKTVQCELKGCECKFEIEIVPKQYVYPKYCILHRNKFKRDIFLKRNCNE